MVAGVVWFSNGKERSGKARSVRTVVTNKQTKQATRQSTQPVTSTIQQSVTSSSLESETFDAMMEEGMYMTRGIGDGDFVFSYGVRQLNLTFIQETQLKSALDALKNHVMEMLSDAASYQQTDVSTIVIKTELSQAQTDEIENRLRSELRDIVGVEKLQFLDDRLDRSIRDYISLLGSSERQYTIIGMDGNDMRLKNKFTERPLKIADAFVVKSLYYFGDGAVKASRELVWQSSKKEPFIKKMEEMGGIGAVTIKMINELDN